MTQGLNLSPLLESFVIRDKHSQLVPFLPNRVQKHIIEQVEDDYAAGKPTRLVTLKARQLGCSTIAQAILFSMCVLEENTNAVVVAHRADSAEELFGISKRIYDNWPFQRDFPARYSTRRELVLQNQSSSIRVMTADKADAGRGRTLSYLHASELAFYRQPTQTMVGFQQAIPNTPGTVVFVESTANGAGGFFHDLYMDAKEGGSDFVPMFFPWFIHHEYIPCFGTHCVDGTCETCQKHTKGLKPKGEEQDLVKMGATLAHIAWRRWAIPNLCYGDIDFFRQEYPATDMEAFLASGVSAFNPLMLRDVFEPETPAVGKLVQGKNPGDVEFTRDPHGPLRLYRRPSDDVHYGKYFIGADPAHGVQGSGDFAAAQVINRHNKEQVAVWQGRINPIAFAEELAKLGTYYNMATISPDIMGGGAATLGSLTHIYPNIWEHRNPTQWPGSNRARSLGFLGSWQRKQWMVAKLAEYVERNQITIHDAATYREMSNYVFYGSKGWGDVFGPATRDGHDDLVSALAICVLCESTEDRVAPMESPDRDRPDGVIYGTPVEQGDPGPFEPFEDYEAG